MLKLSAFADPGSTPGYPNMEGFTHKVSELEPLFTSKVRFVVFGETLKTKSGLSFAHVAGHKYCEGSCGSRPW